MTLPSLLSDGAGSATSGASAVTVPSPSGATSVSVLGASAVSGGLEYDAVLLSVSLVDAGGTVVVVGSAVVGELSSCAASALSSSSWADSASSSACRSDDRLIVGALIANASASRLPVSVNASPSDDPMSDATRTGMMRRVKVSMKFSYPSV